MSATDDQTRLSPPTIYLIRMGVFLALAAFVALILHRQIERAFMANPGLNGLILGVLAVGVFLAITTVTGLYREIGWANGWGLTRPADAAPPVLLAPMARLARETGHVSTQTMRAILDSVALRLDEKREILRYLTGLLIFLGLLGTFWGLLETVGSIGGVINAMKGGADSAALFEDLKAGIARPLDGMSLSFTASLFGLAGSLVLGFLDLQAGQAQNRFYTELEDRIAARAHDELRGAADPALAAGAAETRSTAMSELAAGVQALVQHMRAEQQMIRNWLEDQAAQNREMKKALERLAEKEHR